MKKLLQKLKELNLPEGEFAIFGSGPACIRGLREIGDLDIIVTENLFNSLKNKSNINVLGKESSTSSFHLKHSEESNMGFYNPWKPGDWNVACDVNKLIQEADIIEGFPFVKLEEVLKYKKLLKREKDLVDIKLIEDFLNN